MDVVFIRDLSYLEQTAMTSEKKTWLLILF